MHGEGWGVARVREERDGGHPPPKQIASAPMCVAVQWEAKCWNAWVISFLRFFVFGLMLADALIKICTDIIQSLVFFCHNDRE